MFQSVKVEIDVEVPDDDSEDEAIAIVQAALSSDDRIRVAWVERHVLIIEE